MSFFPLPNIAPVAGLFDNLVQALDRPEVKAGLLQAGSSMLNPNPNVSPFAQIFTGVNEGVQAHQRYQDLETQRQVEKNRLLAEQEREDRKFGLQMGLNAARMKQIENSIATSQENSKSLGSLRAAQTERARRAPAGSTGDKTRASAWRAFYRQKVDPTVGTNPTPELVAQWRAEFDQLEGGLGGSPSGTAQLAQDPAVQRANAIRELVEDQGYTVEQAEELLSITDE
jgi:hypothetical protein